MSFGTFHNSPMTTPLHSLRSHPLPQYFLFDCSSSINHVGQQMLEFF